MQFWSFSQKLFHFLGSPLSLPAHGWVGARATSSLAAHFALRNTASNSAEKKGSPSEGVAEGGGWGEEFRHARAEAKRFRPPDGGGTEIQKEKDVALAPTLPCAGDNKELP